MAQRKTPRSAQFPYLSSYEKWRCEVCADGQQSSMRGLLEAAPLPVYMGTPHRWKEFRQVAVSVPRSTEAERRIRE
jgi:hypothetical protein